MALGGGTFLTQNKILAGSYIRFISKAVPTAGLLDRGIAAIGLDLDWGIEGKIYEVIESDLIKNSLAVFGYDYSNEKLNPIKDIFKNAVKLYVYRLNGGGVKASNTFATAKYSGIVGNNLRVVISADIDDETLFDVSLFMGTEEVDKQIVASAADLVDNDYVVWKKDATLSATAGIALSGGTSTESTTTDHQNFLNLMDSYPDTNAVGYAGTEPTLKALYSAWAENQREKVGTKVQAVVYGYAPDNEAVVNVKNRWELVYWALGVIAGMAVNESATNKKYDGSYEIEANYTQSELEKCIKNGEWVLHKVGNELHVLEDINSLTTVTVDKGEIFKDNQTIRIIDQLATAVANVFNTKYLGKCPNDADGRLSLWNDVCKVHTELQSIRALENFNSEDVVVMQGDAKTSVVINESITIVNTMVKLYMTVVVG